MRCPLGEKLLRVYNPTNMFWQHANVALGKPGTYNDTHALNEYAPLPVDMQGHIREINLKYTTDCMSCIGHKDT